MDRPVFRGPDKEILHDRDNLKKIVVNMRDMPAGNEKIKQSIINAEDMPRQAGSRSFVFKYSPFKVFYKMQYFE